MNYVLGSGNRWSFGSVNYNIPAALSPAYYNAYAAVLYYV